MARLLSLHRLAERFRLPAAWLKAAADDGRIPCLRIGRRVLFDPDAVEEALAKLADRPSPRQGVTCAS